MDYSPGEGSTSHFLLLSDSVPQPSNSNSDTDVSTDISIAATPQESGTPTGTVIVNSRDRSGTVIARPIWDHIPTNTGAAPIQLRQLYKLLVLVDYAIIGSYHRELPPESSADTSRPDTETEDDGDIDMDRMVLEDDDEEEEEDSGRMDSDVPSASTLALASPNATISSSSECPAYLFQHITPCPFSCSVLLRLF
jgi:hypothetical protein